MTHPDKLMPLRRFARICALCNSTVTCMSIKSQFRPEEEQEAAEWKALSDPTRRRILDLLSVGPLITGGVADEFDISRIAVMKHLEVLAEAGLVLSRKRGRERWHYVNLAPVMRLHERWASPAAAGVASSLLQFKGTIEGPVAELETIDLEFEVAIAADRARVFSALVSDVAAWWGTPFVTVGTTGLTLDRELGGVFAEHYDDGGRILANVTGIRRDQFLQLTGPFHLGAAMATAEVTLTDAGPDETTLGLSFRGAGLMSAEIVEGFSGGWRELIGVRLKAFVEDGTRLGLDPGPTTTK